MSAITRRTFLALTAVAASVDPASAKAAASQKLDLLIAVHQAAYAELHRVVHRVGSSTDDRDQADRAEQAALLAICSHPISCRDDGVAKARYLLAVEARGELDLPEHMQAILNSMT